jgi:hypothetical protein
VFERKIIWRIYRPICVKGNWKIKTNEEIDELIIYICNEFCDVFENNVARICCKMTNNKMPKILSNAKMEGRRRRGRQRSDGLTM